MKVFIILFLCFLAALCSASYMMYQGAVYRTSLSILETQKENVAFMEDLWKQEFTKLQVERGAIQMGCCRYIMTVLYTGVIDDIKIDVALDQCNIEINKKHRYTLDLETYDLTGWSRAAIHLLPRSLPGWEE